MSDGITDGMIYAKKYVKKQRAELDLLTQGLPP